MDAYFIARLLPVFVYPLGLGLLLWAIALFMLRRCASRPVWWLGMMAWLLLFMASMPQTARWLSASLAGDYAAPVLQDLADADAIVVLGGIVAPTRPGEPADFGDAIDRLLVAAEWYHRGQAPVVIVSGGAAAGFVAEARLLARLLERLGVPGQALIIEDQARNTHENAMLVKKMAAPLKLKRILLVTSAYHMRRAQAVFQRQGFEVVPLAVDWPVEGQYADSVLAYLPDAGALFTLTRVLKEYLGWWVYRWRGWL